MKRKPKRKPRDNHNRLCNLFVVADDALNRARQKLEAAEQFEHHLDMLATALSDIAGMSDDGLLDQSDSDIVYRMFIEAQPFVAERTPALKLALSLATGVS
jgi:hypothetical protein